MTKQELINKLKELGVYLQWEHYVIEDAKEAGIPIFSRIHYLLNNGFDWEDFIVYSFPWKFTDEGEDFWDEISKK